MGRKKGSFEKAELTGAGDFGKAMGFKFGKIGEKLLFAGVWCIAEAFKGRELQTGMDKTEATEELIEIMEEAARNCDGAKLRLLAEAVEQCKLCNAHDPLRAYLLTMKEMHFGPKIVFPARTPPKTAQEVQDDIKSCYPRNGLPSLKNIHEVARELFVTLAKAKSGAPPGAPRKSPRRP